MVTASKPRAKKGKSSAKSTSPKVSAKAATPKAKAKSVPAKPKPVAPPRFDADAEPDDEKVRSNPLGLDVDAEVLEFIEALDRFKKDHGRPFPSWSEVLHVLRGLGYRRA
jgi:hypothetical protein